MFWHRFFQVYELDLLEDDWFPAYTIENLKNTVLSLERKFVVNHKVDPGHYIKIAEGTLNGTVLSGIPFTTLNNTLRTLTYLLVAIKHMGLSYDLRTNTGDLVIYAAGDD